MADYKKQCLVSVRGSKEWHGLAAASLQELLEKACKFMNLDFQKERVTLVLAEDGTIVEDEDYFMCLPPKTKFMVLTGNKKWSAPTAVDGGTAWMARESVDLQDVMELDGLETPKWKALAAQLKENLSNIIIMSEAELQTLIEVPVEDLSREVSESHDKVRVLQDTLQRVLDRREEERQSKQLLQLYLQAITRDEGSGMSSIAAVNTDEVDAGQQSRTPLLAVSIIKTLKEKKLPHLSLSNSELEAVTNEDSNTLAVALNWKTQKAVELQNSCLQELQNRSQQAQCLNSLATLSKKTKYQP
ncbi:DNA fragmentation factor subunit alpha [Pelobates cultripes]|uniref:DNAation factor subunit alpha n=1 Tax=Pelobates cultripes TaxID=61616 RepID=A0AAD1T7D6_PELCU|nr:DNA fragmentation factor subunit alpha [Pelobates cultripes]